MKFVVGLGNPGPEYKSTRHNVGFMAVDFLANRLGLAPTSFKNENQAKVTKTQWSGIPVLLAKPQTFMNLSGNSVGPLLKYYNLECNDLLVIHDEIDQPFNTLRFHINRGHGGHNGIRHIHQVLQTNSYTRLRMGVGRPNNPQFSVADYVLHPFSEDSTQLNEFLNNAVDAIEYWLQHGTAKAANKYNSQQ
ncbi:MAG: aminoacyl-tRNA hydrolase [Bdellovibrionales bacterium]|nr:aminoacyl-tRNA hydrolase [Bdellovibrionales bacterium]